MRTHSIRLREEDYPEGMACSVCGKYVREVWCFYDISEEQEKWFQEIWHRDPYVNFWLCGDCLGGKTPDDWLEERVESSRKDRQTFVKERDSAKVK